MTNVVRSFRRLRTTHPQPSTEHRSTDGRQFTLEARSAGTDDRSNLSDSTELSYRSDVLRQESEQPASHWDCCDFEPVLPGLDWPDASVEMSIGELLRLFAPQGQPYVSPGQRPGIPSLLSPTSPERAILNGDSRIGPPFQGYVRGHSTCSQGVALGGHRAGPLGLKTLQRATKQRDANCPSSPISALCIRPGPTCQIPLKCHTGLTCFGRNLNSQHPIGIAAISWLFCQGWTVASPRTCNCLYLLQAVVSVRIK
jgi:hypothetical protein